ncbi:hypothetical protein FRC08_006143 [Ceratobasidium sp. 394]|nr:hypothetical protein FRC08_006143 [Ceratobasidium sp. 394]
MAPSSSVTVDARGCGRDQHPTLPYLYPSGKSRDPPFFQALLPDRRLPLTVVIAMSKPIEVAFDLSPPPLASSNEVIPSHQTYTFPVTASAPRSSDYYASLRHAIAAAKEQTGTDLTKYRDLAADAEKAKGLAAKPASDDEDEAEEE